MSVLDANGEDVKLYPNPTDAMLRVEWNRFNNITLSELSGRELLRSYDPWLDVRSLSPGIYIATLMSSDGEKLTFRVIKQ